MMQGEMLYEGKAKRMYATGHPDELVMEYKDSLTAFDATKKGSFEGKGSINNRINAILMTALGELGIETSFIRLLDESRALVRKVTILPIEVIVRYEAQGSLCRRYGIEPGLSIDPPLLELCLKDDALHDPVISAQVAALMGLATSDEIALISWRALVIGEKLREIYGRWGIRLIDFKLEFGRFSPADGSASRVILADEITPDTCRLVDAKTGEKFDKDLFRFDLGDIGAGYSKLLERLQDSAG
ncbi:phosphoribosylaminoimidazolesuccinocarboxamide synthase [bacterium]|nr:phosphoribosylaminoimidazolesuccinocarboxamide synthase [bacterium]